jgi:hypothetical protein
METALTALNVAVAAMLLYFAGLLKGFLSKYLDGKGTNLATKEDIGRLTDITEGVRTQFARQLENYKQNLQYDLQIDTNAAIAFRQKARESLEKVNLALVEIQTYCWDSSARLSGSEHYLHFNELQSDTAEVPSPVSFLYFRSKLDRMALTESLYLPDSVVQSVIDLANSVGNLGAAEVAHQTGNLHSKEVDLPAVYNLGLESAKNCQRAIRSELVMRPSKLSVESPVQVRHPAEVASESPSA